jgi:hypothetical protein
MTLDLNSCASLDLGGALAPGEGGHFSQCVTCLNRGCPTKHVAVKGQRKKNISKNGVRILFPFYKKGKKRSLEGMVGGCAMQNSMRSPVPASAGWRARARAVNQNQKKLGREPSGMHRPQATHQQH